MQALLAQFISTFQQAIRVEMDAMRQQMGPFEVPLANGQLAEGSSNADKTLCQFQVLQPNDKLVLQAECTLTYEGGQRLVTITAIEKNLITLQASHPVPLQAAPYALIIYPWFLYERLIDVLTNLPETEQRYLKNALMLFGKVKPEIASQPLQLTHHALNASQQAAVQLCSDSNLAFIWGPPGTGKTTTLGHIVTELLAQGQRILLTSTTNAAVDQALAKLADLETAAPYFQRGHIVRLGQTRAETFGTSLGQVVNRLNEAQLAKLRKCLNRQQQVERQIPICQALIDKLADDNRPVQLGFFQAEGGSGLTAQDYAPLFSAARIQRLLAAEPAAQASQLARRKARLESVQQLGEATIEQLRRDLRYQEQVVVKNSQLILSTMANTYMSPLVNGDRFDVVIVEEAGMAILPILFYCATLAKTKIIIVGDPKQLPPIVQSRADFVQKAMGRNIFAVTVPEPALAKTVVMLDTQYRMHPKIGNLVSSLFYEGKLQHGPETETRQQIAAKAPYPAEPLVVIDTHGQTTCATRQGNFSRFNAQSGQTCIDLALEAIRAGIESVAIITPYVAQSRLIRQELAHFPREKDQIACHTVHRFQGNERDLVIFDAVDTAPFSPGVLLAGQGPHSSASNLINVSLSRARGKLIIVADVAYFQQRAADSILTTVLSRAIEAGYYLLLIPNLNKAKTKKE